MSPARDTRENNFIYDGKMFSGTASSDLVGSLYNGSISVSFRDGTYTVTFK
ncbi:hypothetical protein [Heliorestis acidaminivorans]|uniref:hypothetical protein n=1 Tax=Heliorestis acidaminivorans TaxID=553427 RepID=UPI0014795232|nr:hypothetical protein [Heliorestis acidaminivorans]